MATSSFKGLSWETIIPSRPAEQFGDGYANAGSNMVAVNSGATARR